MEPQFKTPVTARIRGSDRSLPPFGDRNQLKTNDKVYGMTPPGVFFLAIFQQTANLKQICLYDSAICQQLQFEHHPKSSGQNDHLILYSMTDWLLELYADEVVGFKMNPTTLEY